MLWFKIVVFDVVMSLLLMHGESKCKCFFAMVGDLKCTRICTQRHNRTGVIPAMSMSLLTTFWWNQIGIVYPGNPPTLSEMLWIRAGGWHKKKVNKRLGWWREKRRKWQQGWRGVMEDLPRRDEKRKKADKKVWHDERDWYVRERRCNKCTQWRVKPAWHLECVYASVITRREESWSLARCLFHTYINKNPTSSSGLAERIFF